MHVVANRLEVTIAAAINDQRLVTSAEKVTEFLVAPVESDRVGAEQPLHAGHNIRLGCFDDQMKVIRHQTVRMHLPLRLLTGLLKRLQKAPTVCVVLENA